MGKGSAPSEDGKDSNEEEIEFDAERPYLTEHWINQEQFMEEAKKFGLKAGEGWDLTEGWDFNIEAYRKAALRYQDE